MMPEPLITSLLDTDLYKFTMMQCVFHHFRDTQVKYQFISRKPIDLTRSSDRIQQEIHHWGTLRFNQEELTYLANLPYITQDFIDYLKSYQPNLNYIHINSNDGFQLTIEGPWLDTILFEVPLLAIISESYYQTENPNFDLLEARNRLKHKIFLLRTQTPQLHFTDFGTRRRFSKAWQAEMIERFIKEIPDQFAGTSNVLFAKQFNTKPIGTMAHEYLQACQALAPDLLHSQQYALEKWLVEYPDHLKIALTDVITMDQFLTEFTPDLAKRYDGLRQDSGDPIKWGKKALMFYKQNNIETTEKTLVFSDGLTIPKAIKIYQTFRKQFKLFFGIGTNLTNDTGVPPIDIVIKMTRTNEQPVIKISDSPGKIICDDPVYLEQFKKRFNLK